MSGRRVARSAVGAVAVGAFVLGAAPAAQAQPTDQAEWRVRQQIVETALAEVGAREVGGVNAYPEKYTTVDPGVLRPAEWCGVFVNWAWAKAGVTERPGMRPQAGTSPLDQGHWATYWQKWGKDNGRWKDVASQDVEVGDAVVYGNYPAMFAHVGLVVEVRYDRTGLKATHVRTVEGNYGDRVAYTRWRKVTELTASAGLKASGFVSPF